MKEIFIFFSVLFLFASCDFEKKQYGDYNPEEFYEVQGVVTSVVPTPDPFDSYRRVNIKWEYHFDKEPPLKGAEKYFQIIIQKGYPVVILVNKEDIKINFFARIGYANDSLYQEWAKTRSPKSKLKR